MKRVLQIVTVALALTLGAGTARASVIAEFTWAESDGTTNPFVFDTDFRLTNLSSGVLDSIVVKFDLIDPLDEVLFVDADMQLTTVGPGGQSFNFVVPTFRTVQSVSLSFVYIDVDQTTFAFQRSYDRSQLVAEEPDPQAPPDWSPTYYTHPGELFDVTRDTIPEPASMTLFGLGLAAAAIVRRRRH